MKLLSDKFSFLKHQGSGSIDVLMIFKAIPDDNLPGRQLIMKSFSFIVKEVVLFPQQNIAIKLLVSDLEIFKHLLEHMSLL